MESLIVLIPLSIVLVAGATVAFLWAVNNGQYDELDRDARAALEDLEPASAPDPNTVSRRTATED